MEKRRDMRRFFSLFDVRLSIQLCKWTHIGTERGNR